MDLVVVEAAEAVVDLVVAEAEEAVVGLVVADVVEAVVDLVVAEAAVEAVAEAEEAIAETATRPLLYQLKVLQDLLERQGLVFLGVVSPDTSDDFQKYRDWLEAGNHGNLFYLEKNQDCRRHASAALREVHSVIVFGLPYAPSEIWPMTLEEPARVAAYARFSDYHELMKKAAESAMSEWEKLQSAPSHWRVAVDTVPLLERALARKSGTGFIGKNTCFIHEQRGSFLLLGEILTSTPLPFSENESDLNCGSCTLCQVECPTGALNKDYQIDSRKCLSYWTIEQRGPIPEEFWPGVGKYWFGCDICQLVCPYNQESKNSQLPSSIKLNIYPSLFEISVMNEAQYEKYFGGTALTRAKRNGLRRNALIAMAVNKDPRLKEAIELSEKDSESPILETLDQIKKVYKL